MSSEENSEEGGNIKDELRGYKEEDEEEEREQSVLKELGQFGRNLQVELGDSGRELEEGGNLKDLVVINQSAFDDGKV